MNFLDIFLGFLTSAGGFIDITNIVFNPQSAASFGYLLLWPLVVGLIGIATYAEMCGRVAAIAKKPVFDLVRERTGFKVALTTLVASNFVNILTCIAEVGGVAIVLQLLLGWAHLPPIILAGLALILIAWLLPFQWIEWSFGLMGLLMAVFLVSAIMLHPNWGQVAEGFVPNLPHVSDPSQLLNYFYFVVGLISTTLIPYEVFFYSSGGIEEGWDAKKLLVNKITSYAGFTLGAIFAIAISIISADLFFPRGIFPQTVGSIVLGPAVVFGKVGVLTALLGMLFTFGGAALETALSGGYSISQFFGWNWGKYQKPHKTFRFSATWIIIFILAVLILLTGVDPVKVTQYSVIFSAVAFPLTYYPILSVANDESAMGKFKNGRITNILGWIYLFIITAVALAAVPLMFITNGGQK